MSRVYVIAFTIACVGCMPPGASAVKRPLPLKNPGLVAATYPEMLRAANIEGNAKIRFLLDSAGRPIFRSMRNLGATHEVFSAALRRSVLRWSFTVTELGEGGTLADSITVDARYVLEDGPTCPHPPPCASAPSRIPPPTDRVEGYRGSPEIRVSIVSCPQPKRTYCVSSIVVRAI